MIAKGDFITIVSKEYCYPYSAEFCKVLSFPVSVNYVLIKYLYELSTKTFRVSSDYQAVFNNLGHVRNIINLTTHLHQIVQEINLIREKWKLKI